MSNLNTSWYYMCLRLDNPDSYYQPNTPRKFNLTVVSQELASFLGGVMITTTVESNKRKASGKAFQDRHVKKIPKTFHLVRNVITVKTLNCRINLEICIQFQ